MKKIMLASMAILMLLAPLAAQDMISVFWPAPGSEWCLGTTHEILWTGTVSAQKTLTITLRFANSAPGAEPALYIASGEVNDGNFSPWTIPDTLVPGDYYFRVRTDDMSVIGDGPVFKIAATSPAITVTAPKADSEWALGNAYTITWNKRCLNTKDTVTIALRKEDSPAGSEPALYIATGQENDGSYSPWKIPDNIAPGNYFIRVRTDDATVIGDGPVFKIVSLKLITPNGGENWRSGTTKSITWEKGGWDGEVNLSLFQNGKYKGMIARNLPAVQSAFEWKVGTLTNNKVVDAGPGFRVRVAKDYPGPMMPILVLADESDSDFRINPSIHMGDSGIVAPLLGKPDLIVCKYLPEKLAAGQAKMHLSLKVFNVGSADSKACWLKIDFQGFIRSDQIGPIKAGEWLCFDYPHYSYFDATGGSVLYTIKIDDKNEVIEANEENNIIDGVLAIDSSEPTKCSDGKAR